MRTFCNLFYTIWSKTLMVLCILIFLWQTGICFAETTVLYRENDTALKNVFAQWDNYDYRSSFYLRDAIEETIDMVMEYSLYYHREITGEEQKIINADDNYKSIIRKLNSYEDFRFAVVNHTTGRIVSNIDAISYKDSGTAVRPHFTGRDDFLLIIRNSHNPYYESGTITEYTEYVRELAENYNDNFDLYIYFGDEFSFTQGNEDYAQTHNRVLQRVKKVTVLSAVYLLLAGLMFIALLLVSGKNEPGGKVYPGLSDRLPNDLKLLLFLIVLMSMAALYENSLYMAIRADSYDIWPDFSAEFYIVRSYISMLVNVCIILSAGCTIKRQYRLGTLFTNTYIYKFFFERRDRK